MKTRQLVRAGEIRFSEQESLQLFRDKGTGRIYREKSVSGLGDERLTVLRQEWEFETGKRHIIAVTSGNGGGKVVCQEVTFEDVITWANKALLDAIKIWFPKEG